MSDYYTIKILLIGNCGVGKSSILSRFCGETYKGTDTSTALNPISVDFKTRVISLEGKRVRLQMWDAIGDDQCSSLTTNYYQDVDAVIVVYSLTDRNSFNRIDFWLQNIKDNCLKIPLVVAVGNKCDQVHVRAMSHGEIALFPFIRPGVVHYEASALKYINIDEIFMTISLAAMERDKLQCLPHISLNDINCKSLSFPSLPTNPKLFFYNPLLTNSLKDFSQELVFGVCEEKKKKKRKDCIIL